MLNIFKIRARRKQLQLASELRNKAGMLKVFYEAAYWSQPDFGVEKKVASIVQLLRLLDRIDYNLKQSDNSLLSRVVVDHLLSLKKQCDLELNLIVVKSKGQNSVFERLKEAFSQSGWTELWR